MVPCYLFEEVEVEGELGKALHLILKTRLQNANVASAALEVLRTFAVHGRCFSTFLFLRILVSSELLFLQWGANWVMRVCRLVDVVSFDSFILSVVDAMLAHSDRAGIQVDGLNTLKQLGNFSEKVSVIAR
jgi:hypothetical protein